MTAITASAVIKPTEPVSLVTSVALLIRWNIKRSAEFWPLVILVQIGLSVATILGYAMLVGDVPASAARYLATGAATITLISVGMVMAPSVFSQSKADNSLDWLRTMPVARAAFLVADVAMWTAFALPGVVMGALIGAWRFDIDFSLTPWLPVVVLAVAITAASIGYSMAVVLPPMLAQLITQLLTFVVLLFSPVSYPAERMPAWVQTVHEFMPIEPMAVLMRSALMHNQFGLTWRPVIVLAIWTVAGLTAATAALRRRL